MTRPDPTNHQAADMAASSVKGHPMKTALLTAAFLACIIAANPRPPRTLGTRWARVVA